MLAKLRASMDNLRPATRANTSHGLARGAGHAPLFPTSGTRGLVPPATRTRTLHGDSLKLASPSLEKRFVALGFPMATSSDDYALDTIMSNVNEARLDRKRGDGL